MAEGSAAAGGPQNEEEPYATGSPADGNSNAGIGAPRFGGSNGGRAGGSGTGNGDNADEPQAEGNSGGGGSAGSIGGGDGEPPAARVQWLGPCSPLDLSDDGRTVLALEGLWNATTGWVPLPDLPGGVVQNTPRVLSGDGQVVFGNSSSDLGDEIYRWTAEGGIEGLGQPYFFGSPLPSALFAQHTIDTNQDGSTLFGLWYDDDWRLFRWTADLGVVDVPVSATWTGAAGNVIVSANGQTVFLPAFIDSYLTTLSNVQFPDWWPDSMTPTALSGDGRVPAIYNPRHGGAPVLDDCAFGNHQPGCGAPQALYSYDYTGSAAVGSEFTLESDLTTNFYWTRTHGTEILTDAFTNRGIFVNLNLMRARADGSWDWGGGDKSVLLSTNGKVVLGIGWHARPDLPETLECFLATMEEPDPPLDYSTPTAGALTAPPAACGNGVVEAGEQCDDGNRNDADGCSARCQRPKLAARASGSCALGEDGSAACWGDTVSSLGVRRAQPWTPEAVPSLENANQLSLGNRHACAVLTSGRVECWGRGGAGQLGNGALLDSATPVEVNGITDAVHVSVRNESSCAVLGDGSVQCWGHAALVPSGTGALADSSVPVTIPGLDQVIQVAQLDHLCPNSCSEPADFGACALRADSSVWCWGAVPSDEGLIDSTVPVRVLDGVRQIAAGEDHVCLLLEAGNARCWGTFHQHTDWRWDAGWVLTLPPDTIALAGGLSLACALAGDGRVYCAGSDDWGGLGRGRRYSGPDATVATPVSTITNAVHLAVGVSNACAALASGTVSCWGVNDAGQVGLGSEDGTFPTVVPLAHRFRGLP